MQVNPTVLLAKLPVFTLLPPCVPQMLFQRFKKNKNPSLQGYFVYFSSDFDNALFNSIMAPNPAAATREIPRRQGVGGESGSAVPSPAQLASLALPCRRVMGGSAEDEMKSRGTRLT